MERLTTRYTDHAALKLAKDIGEWCISHDPQKDDYSIYGDAVERLAAYEDTGLMPKDVTDLMAAHGTAILELSEYRSIGTAEHLKEIAQAEQDGRLVVLPVGVDRLTLLKELRDLEQVEYGDAVENYTAGYRNGHKNGSIETLRRVLGVTDETTQDAAMKGGAE